MAESGFGCVWFDIAVESFNAQAGSLQFHDELRHGNDEGIGRIGLRVLALGGNPLPGCV